MHAMSLTSACAPHCKGGAAQTLRQLSLTRLPRMCCAFFMNAVEEEAYASAQAQAAEDAAALQVNGEAVPPAGGRRLVRRRLPALQQLSSDSC